MVATPTFTAPIGDRLTGNRIKSRQESRIASSLGPLWMVFQSGPVLEPRYSIAEVIADDMGLIVRRKRITFLRPVGPNANPEFLVDVGGNADVIWLATQRSRVVDNEVVVEARIYDLSPVDFRVRRQSIVSSSFGAWGADGDSTTIYMGGAITFTAPVQYALWKINATTLTVVATKALGEHWPIGIAGDKHGCWVAYPSENKIRAYTSDLGFIGTQTFPLTGIGHQAGAIGGSSQRIYCTTFVERNIPDWPIGTYIHTIRPSDFTVVRTYGPWVSGRPGAVIGGT